MGIATPINRQEAIEQLVHDLGLVLQRNQPIIDQLKGVIKDLESPEREIKKSLSEMMEPGETVETDLVSVQMRNGYERRSWESDKLEGFAIDHPEILQWRKVAEVGPSLVVKQK